MTLVLLGSFLLAAVFATAGIAKLRDLSGSRDAMHGFGVPASLVAPLGVAVPVAELATAVLLIVGPTRTWGALGALALLAGFSLAIAWNLGRGRTPDCHCFGQLHSSPAGPGTLARNAGLIALAGLVASQADPVATAIAAAGVVAVAVGGWAASPWIGSAGTTGSGLPLGTPAPSFALPRLDGHVVDLESLLIADRPALLLFSDPGCGPCKALAPDVADWQRRHLGELTIAVIESRRNGSEQPATDEHGRRNVLLQNDGEVAAAYRAQGTPTAVLVGADGRIASAVEGGSVAIEALVAANVHGFEPRPAVTQTGNGWALPRRISGPLVRRELLVRGAAAGAALSAALTWPAQAANVMRGRPRCGRYLHRCGDRCCRRGAVCRRGRCVRVCDEHGFFDPDPCRGDCTNFEYDNRNCGGCGKPCEHGEVCAGGQCARSDDQQCDLVCTSDQICCQGICRDPRVDTANCGGCGVTCSEGQECCHGRCIDPARDHRYCGGCIERPCGPKQVCHNGRCRDECPRGLRQCGRTCGQPSTQACCKRADGSKYVVDREDMQFDDKNCGECGRTCSGPFDTGECCGGDCCNYNADTCCPGGCKNLAQDEENCGECGNVCEPNEFCRFGVCTCPLGQEC